MFWISSRETCEEWTLPQPRDTWGSSSSGINSPCTVLPVGKVAAAPDLCGIPGVSDRSCLSYIISTRRNSNKSFYLFSPAGKKNQTNSDEQKNPKHTKKRKKPGERGVQTPQLSLHTQLPPSLLAVLWVTRRGMAQVTDSPDGTSDRFP